MDGRPGRGKYFYPKAALDLYKSVVAVPANQNPLMLETLDERLQNVLKTHHQIEGLFGIQQKLLEEFRRQRNTLPRDLCLSAPTGSGKTLAYLLPILEYFAGFSTSGGTLLPQVKALIVVPGRELAHQVHGVLEPFAKPLNFSIGMAVGQSSFSAEQRRLVSQGESLVHVLIATPGRLVDHLDNTPGFTLQHVQWLVLDEADKLLDGVLQEWLLPLFASLDPHGHDPINPASVNGLLSVRSHLLAPFKSPAWTTPLRKIICSATLTKNPAKLAQLRLANPIHIHPEINLGDETIKYTLPSELSEKMYVCEEERKPLALIHLLRDQNISRSICFTKSVDAAERLARLLLHVLPDKRIEWYSSEKSAADRTSLLERFNEGLIDLLVCSDAAARGLDLTNVEHVINYDVPKHTKAYVHRVGRTARAGRPGNALTILAIKEAHHFRELLQKTGRSKLPSLKIPHHTQKELQEILLAALSALKS